MQELLGRISRLDPSASLGLRVIACFDELVVGNVNTRALLAAAASLAGCVAGFGQVDPARTVRIAPDGHPETGPVPQRRCDLTALASEGLTVWLERQGAHEPNDQIILERLALAVRVRHGKGRRDDDNRRHFGQLVDEALSIEQRSTAAAAMGLMPEAPYQVVAAPLFAVWLSRPSGPEDVVPTQFGPIHALVVPAGTGGIEASPCGVGVATAAADLHHSFRTALVALRLCEPPTVGQVHADSYGGLVSLLADSTGLAPQPDVELLVKISAHPWGQVTLDAIVRSGSVRQAARDAGVHHSTMQQRVDTVIAALGFDPFDGFGRTRLGAAYLMSRLRNSRVLDLPAPKP